MSQAGINSLSSQAGVVFSVTGTNGVTAAPTTGNVIVSGVNATTSSVGVASFNPAQFTVTIGGQVSIINEFAFSYIQINHASSPYTVMPTDDYISVDTSGGTVTILLPNAPTIYKQYNIKDRTGNASVNNISVTTVGGIVTIDQETTDVMDGNFDSIQLLFNGTNYEVF